MTLTIAAWTKVVHSRETVRRKLHSKPMSGSAPYSVPMITERACKIGARSSENRAFGEGGSLLLVEHDIQLLAKDISEDARRELHDKYIFNLIEQLVFHFF
jgi:hypothetical protein